MDSNGNLRLCLEYGDGISMLDFIEGKFPKTNLRKS